MKRLLFVIGLIVVLLAPVMSEAVPIVNSSFEAPALSDGSYTINTIPGWSILGTGSAGVLDPYTSLFPFGIPDGENVAYANPNSTIYQLLDYRLTSNTTLTLSVDVGWRPRISMPTFEIQLLAGGTLLVPTSYLITPLIQGQFVTSVISYDVLADNPLIGNAVQIALINTGRWSQVNFDNVRLENHSVPEPSTLLLLGAGLFGFGIFARKRRK